MRIIIQSFNTLGIRPQNEDSMEIINNLDGSIDDKINILYAGLFDGHGGGAISKTFTDTDKINLQKYFCLKYSPIARRLCPSDKFNSKFIIPLYSRIQEKLKNYYIKSNTMGSTALISLIYPKKSTSNYNIKIINLGDSRAILCNNYNFSQQLSADHKPFTRDEIKRIYMSGGSLEQSEGDDIRINGMSVSRSFGDLDNKYICQIPDVYDYEINDNKFMVLACDGVWDVLSNQDVVDFILDRYYEISKKGELSNLKGKSNQNIADLLANFAISKGSQDNISIIIIFFMDNMSS